MGRNKETVMIITKEMIQAGPVDEKDLWETPDHIYNPLNEKFHFTLDPCCTAETAKCKYFYTPEDDGLMQSWSGATVFVNPPYSRGNIDLWVKKCYDNRKAQTVVALLPVSTSADWYQKYCLGNTIYWVDKRIRFKRAKYTAPFSSMIVHFNGINENKTFKQDFTLKLL